MEDEVQSMVLPQRLPVGGTAVNARVTQAQRDAAFERLFDEFSAPIFNYVLRMVADRDRAADITQDTFIKAHRKLDSLADESSRRSWLYRIATNTAIDEMRRRRFVT
ncbi:MAG: sigma-70 family RNA polymerase sigma factor, partial [Chloroflexota bacterium]|nr:sigma-70 family RNA polymerase sigma factor [Chloroflexota bacterium]